jgi:transposase
MAVAPWIVSDRLWGLVEPLLPKLERRFRYPGRRRLDDRAALQGILFVLHTGIAWRHLPLELGFGSGSTCYRPLDEWQQAGVWEQLHALLLAELRAAGELEWSVDRARNGSKHHLLVDATGIPLAWTVTGGNRNDVTQLVPLLERVPPVRGRPGRPRRRPERVTADRGYDSNALRDQLRERGITPEIARRKTEHGSGLGRARWVVERTFAWLHKLKRLLVRYDRRHEIHEAFLALGCCLVCFRRLQNSL